MTTPRADIDVVPRITEATLLSVRSRTQHTIHKEEGEEKAPGERRKL